VQQRRSFSEGERARSPATPPRRGIISAFVDAPCSAPMPIKNPFSSAMAQASFTPGSWPPARQLLARPPSAPRQRVRVLESLPEASTPRFSEAAALDSNLHE
jgi:hypothetical protein